MSNSRHHRDTGVRNGTYHDLFVETPEIFQRSSASPNNDDIHRTQLVQGSERFRNLPSCTLPLDLNRGNNNVEYWPATPQDSQDIPNGCARQSCDDTHGPRKWRNQLLSILIE